VPADDLPVLDEAVLDELAASVGGDRAFVVELIEAYLADGAAQVDAITAAIGDGRAEALERPAHTLKSSSATLGAHRLAATSRTLELAARAGSVDGSIEGDVATVLRADWEAAAAALRRWVGESGLR
jgi:HPt (histidine-containing phosphotransfer) domain-containing protein